MNINDYDLSNDTFKYLERLIQNKKIFIDKKDNRHIKVLKELDLIELQLIIPSYVTPSDKGIEYFNIRRQKKKENVKNEFWFPFAVNTIVAILSFALGCLLTYLKLQILSPQ